jgi:hypothetical protein
MSPLRFRPQGTPFFPAALFGYALAGTSLALELSGAGVPFALLGFGSALVTSLFLLRRLSQAMAFNPLTAPGRTESPASGLPPRSQAMGMFSRVAFA